MVTGVFTDDDSVQLEATTQSLKLLSIECSPPQLESLPGMVTGVFTDDDSVQLEATTQFRKLLSIGEFLVLKRQYHFEAAWALTNIASGTSEHTKVVIDHGAVPIFVQLLGSPSDDVCEQAAWALGNIDGDSPLCRDLVLANDALLSLLPLLGLAPLNEHAKLSMLRNATAPLNEHAKLSMLSNATWTLSNFCRGKPQLPLYQHKSALQALERLIHSNDKEVLIDACWALSHLSDGTKEKIQVVRVVRLLRSQGCIEAFCDGLDSLDPDPRSIMVFTFGNGVYFFNFFIIIAGYDSIEVLVELNWVWRDKDSKVRELECIDKEN